MFYLTDLFHLVINNLNKSMILSCISIRAFLHILLYLGCRMYAVNKKLFEWIFGDWEMDTIVGKNAKELSKIKSFTLCCCHTESMCIHNGSEFADHQTLAKRLSTQIYFTHPYSS